MFGVVGAKTNFRENMSTKGKELDEKYVHMKHRKKW